MSEEVRLSDQQFQVVQAINHLGGAGAREVQQQLRHLGLAHTTIATVMSRLEKKGVLTSDVRGRERIYHCLVDEDSIRQSMVSSMISTLFKGDSKALMAHLVSEGEINSSELEELRDLIREEENNA